MKKRGFTLIELLAVIVVIAIIATIATPMVLNTIEDARKGSAESSMTGYIKAIENKIASGLINNTQYENKEYGYKDIEVSVKGTQPTGGKYLLEDGVVTTARFCINGYEVNYTNGETSVAGECTGEDLKENGVIKLDVESNSGNYEINTTTKIEITENTGDLSCSSNNEAVATCSIEVADGKNYFVITTGETKGIASLTIVSAATETHNQAKLVYTVNTTGEGVLSVNAEGYTGVYDGEPHGIKVSVSGGNAIIKYGETEGTYDKDESPVLTNVGSMIVYYEVTSGNQEPIRGSKTITITKADGKVTAPIAKTLGYTGNPQELVEAGSSETGTIQYKLEGGNYSEAIPTGTAVGTYKVYYKVVGDSNHNDVAEKGPIEVSIGKGNNTLTLSANTGTYTYPEGGTFEITENASDGKITCDSNNKEVADCLVEGNIVKVIPGGTEGHAELTITSEATDNYNSATVTHVAKIGKGLLSYTATGYSGVYDGNPHRITVTASGATITYSTDGVNYVSTNPEYINVGEYTVYYKIEQAGYNTIQGTEYNEKVVITAAEGDIVAPKAKTLTYTGTSQELVEAGSSSTGTIKYSLDGVSYSEVIPTGTVVGTYKVYYMVEGDSNHKDIAPSSINVTISAANLNYTSAGYTGVYDKQAHGITVKSEGATIKYRTTDNGDYTLTENPTYSDVGEYTVYYQITREGYITKTGSEKIVITKADNTLTLSANTGSYTYPDGGTFEVIENASLGKLTCTSDNEAIATCSVGTMSSDGTATVEVILGTIEGHATLTITSEATHNYNEGKAAYVVNSGAGLMSYTANGYDKPYDGEAHGITVTSSGATITYGTTKGTYDLTESPTYINVGEYEVFYKIEKAGYTTIELSEKVIIRKADGSFVKVPAVKESLIYTGEPQELVTAGSSNTGTVQYKLDDENYGTHVPTATDAGVYSVSYRVVGDSNHNDVAEKTITVTIAKAEGSVTAPTAKDSLAYTGNAQELINAGNSSTGTIKYKLEGGNYSEVIPTATNPGTYKVYYMVDGDNNHKDVAENSITVAIDKANNKLTLSKSFATYTYPEEQDFEVTANTSGGKLRCESSDEDVATCSISDDDSVITVTPGTTEGTADITVTSAETDYYKAGRAVHTATTKKGTLVGITANGYTGVYDGKEHGIEVTASGAAIRYGEAEGSYTLTSTPMYSDVGTYTVYYEVTMPGYEPMRGNKNVVITSASNPISVTASQTWTPAPTFSTSEQTFKIAEATGAKGTVTYAITSQSNSNNYFTINGTTVKAAASTPAGTYTIVIRATAAGVESANKGYYNYEPGYKDITLTVTIGKANHTLVLSALTGTYTYSDDAKDYENYYFTVDANTSGGTLTCESNNKAVADCLMEGTTVRVIPGGTEGTANITITSAETDNYYSTQAVHLVTTKPGLLSYTAFNYEGEYDGSYHGITVNSSGATIMYGTANGTYTTINSDDPTVALKDVGTKDVYFQISKTGYTTLQGENFYRTVTISKAPGRITKFPTPKTELIYNGSSQELINAGSSSTGEVQYRLEGGSYSASIPTGTNAGTYKVYYKVVGDSNHEDVAEAGPITVTIVKATGKCTQYPGANSLTYTGNAQALVTKGTSCTGTMQYKLGSTGTYATTVPTAVNAGTYVVYYKVPESTNYTGVAEDSVTVTIAKKANTLTLSSHAKTYTYPTADKFTVSVNTSGGALSCSVPVEGYDEDNDGKNDYISSCSISGNTVTVTPKAANENKVVEITIESEATENYKKATVIHLATTKLGNLSVTANGYTGEWDGNAHSVTVTSSDATIKYSTDGTNYTTTKPTFTDIGTHKVWYQVSKEGYSTVKPTEPLIVEIKNPSAESISYTNSSVSSVTNVKQALDYLYENLK